MKLILRIWKKGRTLLSLLICNNYIPTMHANYILATSSNQKRSINSSQSSRLLHSTRLHRPTRTSLST